MARDKTDKLSKTFVALLTLRSCNEIRLLGMRSTPFNRYRFAFAKNRN